MTITLIYAGGCTVEIARHVAKYTGETVYYASRTSICAGRVLPDGPTRLSVTAPASLTWRVDIDQRLFPEAVTPPRGFGGTGTAIGAPLRLDQYNTSVLTWAHGRNDVALAYLNVSTGAVIGHAVYMPAAGTVAMPFVGPAGIYIPFVTANAAASWTVSVH